MKFVCLGYFDEDVLDSISLDDAKAFIAECFAYNEELQKDGHVTGIEILQSPDFAKSVQTVDGKVKITDGALTKTEKVLLPIVTLEAESIEHAAELMSKHPALKKSGSFEIRRVDDINELREEIGK